ncbi:MAG: cell division protein FtsL [Bacilli bacterium]|nr:cell division protein FtsL [Bacilli bacterium]
MKKSKKKKSKLSPFEKFLYFITIMLVITSPLIIVFEKSTLSKMNYDVEKIKKQITSQEKENESLQMKINELASLENIQKIIKEKGLEYNNDNIKNID